MFTFQFFNDKIHNYVFLLHNCEFYHSDIESKHTFLKKYTNLAKLIYFSLILREREEKTHIFRTYDAGQFWQFEIFAPQLHARKCHGSSTNTGQIRTLKCL